MSCVPWVLPWSSPSPGPDCTAPSLGKIATRTSLDDLYTTVSTPHPDWFSNYIPPKNSVEFLKRTWSQSAFMLIMIVLKNSSVILQPPQTVFSRSFGPCRACCLAKQSSSWIFLTDFLLSLPYTVHLFTSSSSILLGLFMYYISNVGR